MRLISINYPKAEEDDRKLTHLVESYRKICEPGVLKAMQDVSMVEFKPRQDNFSEPGFSKQLRFLFTRNLTYMVRNPFISLAQIGIAIVQGVFALLCFYNVFGYGFAGIKNMTGSIFFLSANVFTGLVYASITSFQLERAVLLRELAGKVYGLIAYFTAKNLVEIPLMFFFPLITQLIVFWGAPYGTYQQDDNTFWKYYLILFLVSQCAIGYGYCVSAACES